MMNIAMQCLQGMGEALDYDMLASHGPYMAFGPRAWKVYRIPVDPEVLTPTLAMNAGRELATQLMRDGVRWTHQPRFAHPGIHAIVTDRTDGLCVGYQEQYCVLESKRLAEFVIVGGRP